MDQFWQEEASLNVVGSNLGAGKGLFSREISVIVHLFDLLVAEFEHFVGEFE